MHESPLASVVAAVIASDARGVHGAGEGASMRMGRGAGRSLLTDYATEPWTRSGSPRSRLAN